jgi:hypothetical protein
LWSRNIEYCVDSDGGPFVFDAHAWVRKRRRTHSMHSHSSYIRETALMKFVHLRSVCRTTKSRDTALHGSPPKKPEPSPQIQRRRRNHALDAIAADSKPDQTQPYLHTGNRAHETSSLSTDRPQRSRSEPSPQIQRRRLEPPRTHFTPSPCTQTPPNPSRSIFRRRPRELRQAFSMRQPAASLLAGGIKRRSWPYLAAGPGRARGRRPRRTWGRPCQARPWQIPSSASSRACRRWRTSSIHGVRVYHACWPSGEPFSAAPS